MTLYVNRQQMPPLVGFFLAIIPLTSLIIAQQPTLQSEKEAAAGELLRSEFVFPYNAQHNHAPGIVEFPNGDLLCSWYRGAGERKADDVAVLGAWKKSGDKTWSSPFVLADQPGFPDCNTCMHVDANGRLWLFWPTIIANSWESCLTRFKSAPAPITQELSEPKWDREGLVLLKPDDFSTEADETLTQLLKERVPQPIPNDLQQALAEIRSRLSDKLYQRLGWQPRCKPTVLPSGRILLPLYSDTYSISIMAISDDDGKSWYASKPIYGLGNIQPAVLRRNDGTLVAYMRDNGPANRIQTAESKDEGLTWSISRSLDIPNPGSGLDAVRLRNGHWIIIANDTVEGRNKLSLLLSDDEGRSWKWRRALEDKPEGSFHYPCIIQGKDDSLHVVYSYFTNEGKTMKYVTTSEDWILAH